MQGQWQHESPFKEVLGQVTRNADTDCHAQSAPRVQCKEVGQSGSFKERNEGKLCECTFEMIQEAHDKVAMEDVGRLSIAQDVLRKEH